MEENAVEFNIPRNMAAQLGYYVYIYLHPDTLEALYVGKGTGNRILAHLSADGECDKGRAIRQLREAGKQPILKFVRHGLSESEALLVESSLIDVIGLDKLTNKVAGHGSSSKGIMSFEQLRSQFAKDPLIITDPVLMIRVARTFRYDIKPTELYEVTCGTWKLGPRRETVKYVLSVYNDVVQQVYEIDHWQHGGTRHYATRDVGGVDTGRWEFEGSVLAEGKKRDQYLHKNVSQLFKKGSQNPVRYAFPDGSSIEGDDEHQEAA